MAAEGAIYFPTIRVPESTWTNHVLLYWEKAATIVPDTFLYSPDQHDPYTLELIRRELLQQVSPLDAEISVCERYVQQLESLDAEALRGRQEAFLNGSSTPLHEDKLFHIAGMDRLSSAGLASRDRHGWILVEDQTAREFMASLAIACAHPGSALSRAAPSVNWFPASDTVRDISPFFSGRYSAADSLMELLEGGEVAQFGLRVQQQDEERTAAELYVLEQVLPAPEQPVSPDSIESFRKRHGDKLPAFRRHIQQRIGEAIRKDPKEAFASLNSLIDECSSLRSEAEAYLGEAGYHKLSESVLVSLVKRLPLVGKPVDAAVEAASGLKTVDQTRFTAHPLAYAAVAQAALGERVPNAVEVHFTHAEPVFIPRF
jgi:hypothetical protein